MECAERSKDNISHTGRQYNRHATFPFSHASLSLSLSSLFFRRGRREEDFFHESWATCARDRESMAATHFGRMIELTFEFVENEERKGKTTYRSTYRFRGLRRNNRPRLIGHPFFSPRSFEIGLRCKYRGESFHYKRLTSHPLRFCRIHSGARLYTEVFNEMDCGL